MNKTHVIFASAFVLTSIGLSIAAGASNVNAQIKTEVGRLVDELELRGEDDIVGPNFAKVLGFPDQVPTKVATTSKTSTSKTDLETHFVELVMASTAALDNSSVTNAPSSILFGLRHQSSKELETAVYRTDVSGVLTKVVETHGEISDGQPVAGSAKITERDIDAASVKKAFQAEVALAFKWLKKQRREQPSSK